MGDQDVPIIKRYSERKLIDATHLSWNNCMKIFAKYPKVEYSVTPEYTLLNSGTKIGMLNRVLNTNLTAVTVDKTIEEVKNFYKSKGLPFTWQVDPWDVPTNLAEMLEDAGFKRDETPGMVVKIDKLIEPKMPEGFSYERCDTPEKVTTYSWLLCRAYGMPEPVWEFLAGAWINLGLVDYFHDYIGYLHGEPVATASIMYGDGVAGLYNVATLPDARGKGIGAMISYVPFIDAEKNGYRYGILHSSSMGYSVYKRLGFQDLCKLIRYQWNPEV